MFEQEPPSPDNPLFKLKNVVLSAHMAGPIWDTQYPKFRNAFDNIQRVERGERLWLIPSCSIANSDWIETRLRRALSKTQPARLQSRARTMRRRPIDRRLKPSMRALSCNARCSE